MRKRTIIALIAVAAIGVGAYVVLTPKKGTVEWHKREYLKAYKVFHGITWTDRLKDTYHKMRGIRRPDIPSYRVLKTMLSNETALVNLGYLTERELVLSNRTPDQIVLQFYRVFGIRDPFVSAHQRKASVFVRAPRNIFPKCEEMIRDADVPESK